MPVVTDPPLPALRAAGRVLGIEVPGDDLPGWLAAAASIWCARWPEH